MHYSLLSVILYNICLRYLLRPAYTDICIPSKITVSQTRILNEKLSKDAKLGCVRLPVVAMLSANRSLSPACWSTFWKSSFKHQLGCRSDILDSISSFFCILTYAIKNVLIHHIIFWLYLYLLNILYFVKYSCTNIFHRRSRCTFYWRAKFTTSSSPGIF